MIGYNGTVYKSKIKLIGYNLSNFKFRFPLKSKTYWNMPYAPAIEELIQFLMRVSITNLR